MHPYAGEFLGTLLLILLGNGVVANVVLERTKGRGGGWIVITFGWGMAVFVAVWCVGAASGAHLNPAVTLGLAAAGKFPAAASATTAAEATAAYLAAQFLGAAAGALLVYFFYRDHFHATDDGDARLACFCTAPAVRHPLNNLFCEFVGTMVLVLAVLLATEPGITLDAEAPFNAASVKVGLGSLGALPVGLLVFSIGLSLGGTTGYAINPARDAAPRLIHFLLPLPGKRDSDWSYAWVPVAGPLLGALAAAGVFELLGRTAALAAP